MSRPVTQDLLDQIWELYGAALKATNRALGLQPGAAEHVIGTNFRKLRETITFEPVEWSATAVKTEEKEKSRARKRARLKIINGGMQ